MKRTDDPHLILFFILSTALFALCLVPDVQAQSGQDAKIQSAMSAALPSIAEQATIRDWPSEEDGEMTVLREGSGV